MDEEEKVANATHVNYLKIIKDAVLFYTTTSGETEDAKHGYDSPTTPYLLKNSPQSRYGGYPQPFTLGYKYPCSTSLLSRR